MAADQVASLHEHGVDLVLDAAAAAALPEPEGGAVALRLREPSVKTEPLDADPGPGERQELARRRDWTEDELGQARRPDAGFAGTRATGAQRAAGDSEVEGDRRRLALASRASEARREPSSCATRRRPNRLRG